MKYYIKEKVFTFKDKFYVKNEREEDCFYVEGELISFGKKLHIFDTTGTELALVHRKVLSLLPCFRVYVGENQVAEIIKEIAFFRNKYTIKGLDWEVEGNIYDHDYAIYSNGQTIATIAKAWFSWGDSYEIDVASEADPLYALAVVLAIDCVLDCEERRRID